MSKSEETAQPTTKVIVLRKSMLPAIIGAAAIIVLAAVPSVYFYNQYQKSQKLLLNPTEAAKEETNRLVNQVGKLMELPKDSPTIATVADKAKLKSQPFFASSQNGDKVLLYTKEKIAILYRPSSNKIITVAPITVGDVAGANTVKYKAALLNGTTTAGLASVFEKTLKEKVQNIDVVEKGNALKKDYSKTVVVDLNGDKKEAAEQLAKAINAEISSLPAGEASPSADFLIVIGPSK